MVFRWATELLHSEIAEMTSTPSYMYEVLTSPVSTSAHSLPSLFALQLALSNPSRSVLRKLAASGFVNALGAEWFFLSAHESVKSIKSLRSMEGLEEKDVEEGHLVTGNGEKECLQKSILE